MIGFRVDANEHIASGHLMRCIAIAAECVKRGQEVIFILAEDKMTDRLRSCGFPYIVLNSRWDRLDEEIPAMKTVLAEYHLSWLVVDSYHASASYLEELERYVHVLYIDDEAKDIYHVSALLHYGQWADDKSYEERYIGKQDKSYADRYRAKNDKSYADRYCAGNDALDEEIHRGLSRDMNRESGHELTADLLVGFRFVPLRSEFAPDSENSDGYERKEYESICDGMMHGCKERESVHDELTPGDNECESIYDDSMSGSVRSMSGGRERSILITTGGTDPLNVTYKVLERMSCDDVLRDYHKHVIVGGMNQFEDELRRLADSDDTITLHKNITNMSHYMKTCKCAVSAGGTTIFELCACGIPTVCFSFADNQYEFTASMGERNVMKYAGDARFVDNIEDKICQGLRELSDSKTYEAYAAAMTALVDGRGAGRIAEYLVGKNQEPNRLKWIVKESGVQ